MSHARRRTHQWADARALADSLASISGLEFLAAWTRREIIPPMAATLGFELADFDAGHVVITCRPQEFHYNPYGTVHGGLAATLIDTATGCAIHSELAAGTGYATTNLSISYLRPLTAESGEVACTGDVISIGRRMGVADASIVDDSGRTLARGSATCLIIPPEPAPAG